MSNIYEQIKLNGSFGYFTLLRNENGRYCEVSPYINASNCFRDSEWRSTEEKAKANRADSSGTNADYWDTISCTIIDTYMPTFKRFEPGQLVRVREDAEEILKTIDEELNDSMRKMVGKVCEVKASCGSDYDVYTPDKRNHWFFPPQALTPVLPETSEPEETIEIGGKQYTLSEIKKALGE